MAIYIPSITATKVTQTPTKIYPPPPPAPPTNRAAIIKTISVVNKHTLAVGVDVGWIDSMNNYCSFLGSIRYVASGSQLLIQNEITLGVGNSVRAYAAGILDTQDLVDIVICAIERDP